MAERVATPNVAVVLLAAAFATLLGVTAGIDGRYALAAAFGAAFVAVVLHNVMNGLCLMAFLASLDGVPAIGAGMISVPKFAGVLLALSWLATITTRREEQISDARPVFTYLLLLFLGWQAVTMAWATDRGLVIDMLIRYAPNLLLFAIAYTAIRQEKHIRWIVVAVVLATTVQAVLSVLGPANPSATDYSRASGLAGGANELAAALVVGIVLSLALAVTRRDAPILRPLLVFGAALCAFGLFLSLSRGGLVALAAALVVAVVIAGQWRGKVVASGLVVLALAVVYFGAIASLPARERVLEVGGGTGRTDLWTVGTRMVEDRPLLGVGAGNFPVVSIHYLLEPGPIKADEFIITTPKVAHNTFLEVLAESGIPGLALFLGIVFGSVWWMLKAAQAFGRAGDREMELLARGLVVATCGYLVAGMFISANYSKLLWLLLALGPPMLAIARRAERRSA